MFVVPCLVLRVKPESGFLQGICLQLQVWRRGWQREGWREEDSYRPPPLLGVNFTLSNCPPPPPWSPHHGRFTSSGTGRSTNESVVKEDSGWLLLNIEDCGVSVLSRVEFWDTTLSWVLKESDPVLYELSKRQARFCPSPVDGQMMGCGDGRSALLLSWMIGRNVTQSDCRAVMVMCAGSSGSCWFIGRSCCY